MPAMTSIRQPMPTSAGTGRRPAQPSSAAAAKSGHSTSRLCATASTDRGIHTCWSIRCLRPSQRISGIIPSGKDGWEVHFAAWQRKEAGEPIIMLSVGDHDFDTPSETVEACVTALRAGHHHYTQLPGMPRLRAAMAKLSTQCTGIETTVRPGHRRARRTVGALCRRPRRRRPRRPRHRRRALLRHLSRHLPLGRRRLHRGRGARRRRLPADTRGDRGGDPAQHPRHPDEHAQQPDRRRLFARDAGGHRRRLPRPRSLAALRRGLLDAGRRRARLAAQPARHGGAHAGHQLHVEEPRHDRLAHRLDHRARRR